MEEIFLGSSRVQYFLEIEQAISYKKRRRNLSPYSFQMDCVTQDGHTPQLLTTYWQNECHYLTL